MSCPRLSLAQAAAGLQAGGVLLLATDTVPGLHARADSRTALHRILAAKGRGDGKPFLLVAGSIAQAMQVLGPLTTWQRDCCIRCWPGPFSLILPGRPELPRELLGPGATVAVRVPALATLRKLVLAAGHPLVSTSANRSGELPAMDLAAAVAGFGQLVDGAWAPRSGPVRDRQDPPPRPSALVDLSRRPPVVLREGPLPFPCADAGGAS